MNPPNSDTPRTDALVNDLKHLCCTIGDAGYAYNRAIDLGQNLERETQQLRARLEEAEKERDLLKSSDLGFTSTVSPSVEILRPDSVRDFNQAASALSGEAEISDLKTHLAEAQKERDELKAELPREAFSSNVEIIRLQTRLAAAEWLNAKLAAAFDAAKAFIDSHAADPNITDEMCRTYAIYQKKSAALALYREGGGRK